MSKSIKVNEDVYQALLEIGQKRETFSDTVFRLILSYRALLKMANDMKLSPAYPAYERRKETGNAMSKLP